MGTLTPGQMFDHELNAVKGWPSPYAVDKSLALDTGETSSAIKAGMGMYIDPTSKKFKLGIVDGAVTIFALQNADDFDANSDVGNISGGKSSGLVAFGAYELETTEYVSGTYNPNTCLTVTAAGANKGKLVAGVAYTDQICGVVSDGERTNEYSVGMLRFWPTWLPPYAGGSSA